MQDHYVRELLERACDRELSDGKHRSNQLQEDPSDYKGADPLVQH